LGIHFVFTDVIKLGHKFTIFVLILVKDTFHDHIDWFSILLQIVLYFLFKLCPSLLGLGAHDGVTKTAIGQVFILIEFLKFVFFKVNKFWSLRFFDCNFDFWINEIIPSRASVAFWEVISLESNLKKIVQKEHIIAINTSVKSLFIIFLSLLQNYWFLQQTQLLVLTTWLSKLTYNPCMRISHR